jgi:Uma2 family endonuclease
MNPRVQRAETIESWSHDDFMILAPEDGKAELINGEITMAPPAFFQHERLQGFLTTILTLFISRFDLGFVLGSRHAVYISEPDL